MKDQNTASSGRQLRVLIVDDESFMLQAWRKILENQECELNTLSDSTEALRVLEDWEPDVAVLDGESEIPEKLE